MNEHACVCVSERTCMCVCVCDQYACTSMHHDEYRKYLIIRLCPINSAVHTAFFQFFRKTATLYISKNVQDRGK